jgi:membrane protease YdiL (CAAX protease family)
MTEPAISLSGTSVDRLRAWVAQRPLAAFFLLSFIFSWVLWLVPFWLNLSDAVASRHLTAIAAFGPSLAAVTLTTLSANQTGRGKGWAGLERFVLAFLAVGAVYLICLPYASSLPLETSVAGWVVRVLLISTAAWVLAAALSGVPGLSALVLLPSSRRSSPAWYAAALLVFPLLLLAGLGISRLAGQGIEVTPPASGSPSLLLQIVTLFFYILLFGGPLSSEAGWRGFALPRLQERASPLVASLILGLVWAAWRFPLFINGFYASAPGDWLPVFAEQALINLMLAFLYTWLYNHTRGNVLACIFLHASVLTASAFIASTPLATAMLGIAAALCVIESRMWERKLPEIG